MLFSALSRQPLRCQRSTVSGLTINRCRREAGQRRSIKTHKTRSRRPESRSEVGPEGNLELVAEDEILEGEIASRSKPDDETAH